MIDRSYHSCVICWEAKRNNHPYILCSIYQPDTVFSMRRPYDLVAFMKQEDRAVMLNNLKKELLNRKDEIDKNEDRDTGIVILTEFMT